jgi:hypothetical protein
MTIKRITLLQAIAENLQMALQYTISSPSNVSGYSKRAEALIEVIEVDDCGSIGGFDENNPNVKPCSHQLINRFATLCKKNNSEDCMHDVKLLANFYNDISKKVNTTNNKLIEINS